MPDYKEKAKKMTASNHIRFHRWNLFMVSGFISTLFISLAFSYEIVQAAPVSTRIDGMPVFAQERNLSCEYSAARAAAARWGVKISEWEFISSIPYNANPHLGFRGNIDDHWGGTISYGIYAEPIAKFLATKGLQTKLLWDGVEQLKQEVALGRPVVIWVPGGMGWGQPFDGSADGVTFQLMPLEHAVTLYGYDENGVYVADPGFGTYDYYSWATFKRSWAYLGNMAMSVYPAGSAVVSDEKPGIAPQFYHYWLRNRDLGFTGLPIAPPYTEGTKTYQYFERVRLEYDNSQPQNQPIGRGLLGREVTGPRHQEAAFQPMNAWEILTMGSVEIQHYFPLTGFSIDPDFAGYWQNQGGLSLFGYPISRPLVEGGFKVQYFERARLELHTEFTPPVIMKGLLGREKLEMATRPLVVMEHLQSIYP